MSQHEGARTAHASLSLSLPLACIHDAAPGILVTRERAPPRSPAAELSARLRGWSCALSLSFARRAAQRETREESERVSRPGGRMQKDTTECGGRPCVPGTVQCSQAGTTRGERMNTHVW